MAMDRTVSLLVKFAALDKLTSPMKKIGLGSRAAARDIAATTRELASLERAQAKIASFKSLGKGIEDSYGKIDAMRRKIRGLREEIASTDAPTKRMTNAFASAQRQEARLVAIQDEQRSKLQRLQAELKETGVDVGRLGDAELKLASRMATANAALDKHKGKLDRVAASRRRSEKMSAIGGKLQGVGAGASVTGVAMGAPLVDATGEARSFNSVMTDVGIKTGLAAKETAKIGLYIRRLGPDIAQLPEAMGNAFSTLAGLGLDPGVSQRLLRPIGRTATAMEADINDLAKVSYANFTNLKVPIKDTELALDAMAMAGNRGGFEIKDMATYFPTLTGRLQALGQKGVPAVADLAAALQVAFIDTQDASAAATNIENLLAKMNSKETIQNFQKFGVDLPKALKKAYAEGKTPLEAIAELTKKAAGGDLSKLTFLFGDMQAQSGVLAMIQHMEDFQRIRAQANAGKGTVNTAFGRRMSEDDSTKLAKFDAQVSRLKINLGQNLLPLVNRVMEKVGSLADRFEAWSAANPELAGTIVKLAAGAAALLLVFGTIGIIAGTVVAGFGAMATVFGGLWAVITFGFGILGSILGAFAAVVGLPFLAVAAIAGAAIAAGILIYKYWDQIKSAFSTGFNWFVGLHVRMVEIGVNLVRGIINGIGSMFGALKAKIIGLGQNAVGWFKGVLGIHSPSRVFMELGGHMTGGLAAGIDRGAGAPLDRVRALASSAARNAAAIAGGLAIGAAPAAAGAGPAGAGARGTPGVAPSTTHYHHYEITVQGGAGVDIRAQARELLEELKRLQASEANGSYRDD